MFLARKYCTKFHNGYTNLYPDKLHIRVYFLSCLQYHCLLFFDDINYFRYKMDSQHRIYLGSCFFTLVVLEVLGNSVTNIRDRFTGDYLGQYCAPSMRQIKNRTL